VFNQDRGDVRQVGDGGLAEPPRDKSHVPTIGNAEQAPIGATDPVEHLLVTNSLRLRRFRAADGHP
jgi:hypothetical protein